LRLHSYLVRYDSGFAPNPFFGYCTLATCKPDIRARAAENEWIVGTGSANKQVRRGGYLVYAMRVTEALQFQDYWNDNRFQQKKPNLHRSRMHACGDNIYNFRNGTWRQLRSFHTNADGSLNARHVARDTGANRVLVSTDFVYFGGVGPKIPGEFRKGKDICVHGMGRKVFDDPAMITAFVKWIRSLGDQGYCGRPMDWILEEWL
jgi:hypothetical protein